MRHLTKRLIFFAFIASMTHGLPARGAAPTVRERASRMLAQPDTNWSPVFVQPGTDSTVYALLATGDTLVVAGAFERVGTLPAASIALYDGTNWHALDEGLPGSVRAITWWNGDLIAGGTFTRAQGAPADYLARWDGSTWSPLDGPELDGHVYALTVHGATLAVGGSFTHAGAIVVNCIATFDAAAWTALGGGMTEESPEVDALLSYGGQLFAGGHFIKADGDSVNHLARWDGSVWSSMAGGVTSLGVLRSYVYDISILRDQVLIAGYFLNAGSVQTGSIARWKGTQWSGLGSGSPGEIRGAFVAGPRVFAAGHFDHVAYMVPAYNAAQWTGAEWKGMDYGVLATGGPDIGTAMCVTGYRGQIIFGGEFARADSLSAPHLAAWTGSRWMPFVVGQGLSFDATSFVESAGRLLVGGAFWSAGAVLSPAVAAWDGANWSALGAGFNNAVWSVAEYHGDLYAGGYFSMSGTQSVSCIGRWDGTQWQQVGGGVNGPVRALFVWNDQLVVTGLFTRVGGQAASRIAAWDGTAWHSLGTGFDDFGASLCLWNGLLVAGGAFRTAGGLAAGGVATWDGQAWSPCGGGIDATVGNPPTAWAVESYHGDLVVGGEFDLAGNLPVSNVAAWNGSAWRDLGGGVSGTFAATNARVQDLLVDGEYLAVCGIFTQAGSVAANYLARWDGSAWRAIGGGVQVGDASQGGVWGLGLYGGGLFAGGNIWTAGGVPSAYVARWNESDLVTALPPPAGQEGAPGPSRFTVFPSVARRGESVTVKIARGGSDALDLDVFDVAGRNVARITIPQAIAAERVVRWSIPQSMSPGVYHIHDRRAAPFAAEPTLIVR